MSLTTPHGDLVPAGRLVRSPVCWRGLFESSPSRPDSNGARDRPAPNHPLFGALPVLRVSDSRFEKADLSQ